MESLIAVGLTLAQGASVSESAVPHRESLVPQREIGRIKQFKKCFPSLFSSIFSYPSPFPLHPPPSTSLLFLLSSFFFLLFLGGGCPY